MEFELSESELLWQHKVRTFLEEHVDKSLRDDVYEGLGLRYHEGHDPKVEEFYRSLGALGWLTVNWPKEYGGLGLSAREQLIFMQELDRVGAPQLELDVTEIAAIIIGFGTEENKQMWLPKIAAHEISFALGYSEPDAGTDLANLTTRAVLDGDQWVINGTKLWNSGAHKCTHEWMLVRTSPDLKRHEGLSLFIVPLDEDGIEYQRIETWGELTTDQTWFVDVRVPKSYLIGDINMGWHYITAALDRHRVKVGFSAPLFGFIDEMVEYCSTTTIDGSRLIDRPEIRHEIADLMVEVDVVNLLSWEIAAAIDRGESPTIAATAQKVLSSELRAKLADVAMSMCGLSGQIRRGDSRSPMDGDLEFLYRRTPRLRFAGGTNEVMRDIVAQRGLGLPRVSRSRPRTGVDVGTALTSPSEVSKSESVAN